MQAKFSTALAAKQNHPFVLAYTLIEGSRGSLTRCIQDFQYNCKLLTIYWLVKLKVCIVDGETELYEKYNKTKTR